jgi:phage tail sheath protein FI
LPADPTGIPATLSDSDRVSLQMLMIEQCERLRFRFAILDTPAALQLITMQNWPSQQGLINQSAAFAALYYPWLMVTDPLSTTGALKSLPPSGFVAGVCASMDLSVGVWKPPANVELTIAVDVAQAMTDAQQGPLNDAQVNVIRTFPGRGIRIWGARTLAADDSWEFVNVRRLISAIEETVLRSSRWAVFQVNNTALRKALTHSLTVLLGAIWRSGGLAGNTGDEAFYVKCDDTNNPQLIIDAGQVICKVGVAAAAPMEFLVFQVRQDPSGGTVMES